MHKYLYLLGTISSFLSFQVGYNSFLKKGLTIASICFMALTPLIGLALGFVFMDHVSKCEECKDEL